MKNEQGASIQTHQDISTLLINHFSHIALEPSINREVVIRDVMTSIPKIISEEQKKSLNFQITMEEVEEAVRDMLNAKALGPDGFTIDLLKPVGR